MLISIEDFKANLKRCLKRLINHPVQTLRSGHPSFKKEGKGLIVNTLTFSSSLRGLTVKKLPGGQFQGGARLQGNPDRQVRGRWCLLRQLLSDFSPKQK